MSNNLMDEPGDTVRILRPPPRVFTDLSGRNVWIGGVEPIELALEGVEPIELALEHPTNTDPYNSADVAGHLLFRVGGLGR